MTIIVGADGPYSSIHQNMCKRLDVESLLPKEDATPHGYCCDCAVGVSEGLYSEVYPVLKDKFSEFETILKENIPFSHGHHKSETSTPSIPLLLRRAMSDCHSPQGAP
ncbi:hypothetical protein BG011_000817 [Mortierella polycephala]|uniref:Uncharacterized protein n=1 Tax=Mortierella polycephala TaxID=41804 RepID=A0A9P6U6Q3_9FUNG|nr:hypothetical protein BG011_000817 [Mortierella polycephala]